MENIKDYEKKMSDFWEASCRKEITQGDMILMQYFIKTLFQPPEELQFCINRKKIKNDVIKCLDLKEDDVLLDIGTGYGDLLFMSKNQIKKGIGIDIWEEIVKKAQILLKDCENIEVHNSSFQDFIFPKNVTKCVMLAWNCSPLTEERIIEKLKNTNCKLFVNNFGNIDILNIINLKNQTRSRRMLK